MLPTCSHARSPMRWSGSIRDGSRWKLTSRAARPPSRSSGSPTAPARRPRNACAAASSRPSSTGRGHRIIVNLAPADLRKEGSGFDLPIALAVLAASAQIPHGCLSGHASIGELALDGRLRPVPGSLVAAEGARRNGSQRLVCAAESGAEVALAGIEPVPVRHLAEAVAYFRGHREPPPPDAAGRATTARRRAPDLADVRGQERARRVLEIAAAGAHNLLLAGPPGIGKTMLARRLPGILPPLDDEAALEVTRIHSVAGRAAAGLGPGPDAPVPGAAPHGLDARRSSAAGRRPRPGEVDARPSRRAAARRAPRVPAVRARGASPAARGRRGRDRPRRRAVALPGALQARRDDEPLPLRRARRRPSELLVLAAAARPLPRQALPGAPRPVRPRRRAAAAAGGRARRSAGRELGRRAGARRRRAGDARRRSAEAGRGGRRAARARGRATAALGAWAGPRLAGVARRSPRSPGRRRSCPSTSPRPSRTARRRSWEADERPGPGALRRLERDAPLRIGSASRGGSRRSWRRSTRRPSGRGSPRPGSAGSRAPIPASRRGSARSTIPRRACSCVGTPIRRSWPGPRSRSSAPAHAATTERTSRARSPASSPPPG